MKTKLLVTISAFVIAIFANQAFSAGDEENIQKLSSFKSTGGSRGEVIPQDTKFAQNIKRNIIPNIKLPSGFKIGLFAVVPDARNMAVSVTRVRSGSVPEKPRSGKRPTGIWITPRTPSSNSRQR